MNNAQPINPHLMWHLRVFTRATLMAATVAGERRGYNRILDLAFVRSLPDGVFFPVVYEFEHEWIAGASSEPHMRLVVAISTSETIMLDVSMRRYSSLAVRSVMRPRR